MSKRRFFSVVMICLALALTVSACAQPVGSAGAEATHEATDEATHEATHEATDEATHKATHEATDEAASKIPEEFEHLENPFTGNVEAVATGKETYEELCWVCHGKTGQGDGPAAAGLPGEPAKFADCDWQAAEEDGELFYVIVNGEPEDGMPAWGETLTEDQIWQALAYVRSFCQ